MEWTMARGPGLQVTSVEIESETGKFTIRTGSSESAAINGPEAEGTRALNKWLAETNEK